MEKYKYGLLKYNSVNIGDDIQSIAAMRFLPHVDEYLLRDKLSLYKPIDDKKIKLIMNAWWLWLPENFPPAPHIDPLMVSVHIRHEVRNECMQNKKIKNYFMNHSPIGCRDMDTYKYFKSIGIDAYFSGCLTLTLQRNNKIPRENYILCVDVETKIVEEIKRRTNRPVYNISRMLSPYYTSIERLKLAKLFLHLYHNAHCVVSPCLHTILPSVAFETPVLRIIEKDEHMHANSRFTGMEDWFNTATIEEFLNNKDIYDFENPPSNSKKYLNVRESLINTCSQFTGYCNDDSPIDETINPFIELIKLNKYNRNKNKKILLFMKTSELKEAIRIKKEGFSKFIYDDDLPFLSKKSIKRAKKSYMKYRLLSKLFFNKNVIIKNKLNEKQEILINNGLEV